MKMGEKIRRKRRPNKKNRVEALMESVNTYKPEIKQSVTAKEKVRRFLELVSNETSCMRPDIYLDSMRYCDDCNLYEYCNCSLKRLSKK